MQLLTSHTFLPAMTDGVRLAWLSRLGMDCIESKVSARNRSAKKTVPP